MERWREWPRPKPHPVAAQAGRRLRHVRPRRRSRLRPHAPQGGAVRPRHRRLLRRRAPAGDALQRDPALAERPRADQVDRHVGRARPPEGGWRWSSRRTSRRSAWPGCRRSPTTRRPRSRETRSAFTCRRSPSWWPRDAYAAQDALQFIEVEYEVLPAIVSSAGRSLPTRRSPRRQDRPGATTSPARLWEAGDKANCARVFAEADTIVTRDIVASALRTRARWRRAAWSPHGPG